MNIVLVANILAIVGQMFSLLASTRRNKKEILTFQSIFLAIVGVSSFLLKGYSGVITDILGIVRNILAIRGIEDRRINVALIVGMFVLAYFFNVNGPLGYLPILANTAQTLVFLNKNSKTVHIQAVNCFSTSCWAVFNLVIKNYAGATFSVVTASLYLYQILKNKSSENG